ncbi:MAG: adenylate/guanylate cyclase domain-containing protein, partial [Fimbriimonadales bacterium]|nr:adenylate/guanylate cyclase domain-containing protein [Fimbriimonadales bacterium]
MGTVLRQLGGQVYAAWRALGCGWRLFALLTLVFTLLVLLIGGWRAAGWTLLGFWVAANALVGLRMLVWSLVRPHLWSMIASPAFGWSFVGAFLAAILVPVWSAAGISEMGEVSFGSALLLLIAGIVFGFVLVVGFLLGLIGAGLGLMASLASGEQAARQGLAAYWGWQGVGLVGVLLGLPEGLVLAVWLGAPLLTLGTMRLLASGSYIDAWLQRVRPRLRRALILQGRWGTRAWRLDMRGAAIGMAVALLAWLVWQTGVLQPLQASSLFWLIRFRNEPLVLQRKGASVELMQSEATRRVVRLNYDQQGYAALAEGSECAVLARVIRQLHTWRARLILAPLPLLTTEPGQAEPLQRFVQRNQRDLHLLEKAVREAGNVVWIVPTTSRPSAEAQRLLSAGRAMGVMAHVRYFAPGLPVIEHDRRTVAPALAAMHALGIGVNVPTRERFILTDFYGEQPGQVFEPMPLSSILNGKPFYWTETRRVLRGEFVVERERIATQPTPPQQLFAGQIVILPSLQPDLYSTPIGRMEGQELIAHQLTSLLQGATIKTPAARWVLLALLLLGVVVGHLCLRRAPVEAWWTAILMALVVWLGSIGLFLDRHLWFDPLLPLLSVALTALLVSQLTFASESAERARHRALLQRLVAPAVVEQLLGDFETRLNPGGIRCRIGVLFADIRNFTHFAETRTPEQVVEQLNRYLGALTETLHAHHGILDKYTGDGLMAIFAAHLLPEPESEEQLICRAVRTAIAMQYALRQLGNSSDAPSDTPLGIGIGLHFGEAVLGLLGSPAQFNYTAVGRTVVIAARLQALAAAGEIVMSEVVYR